MGGDWRPGPHRGWSATGRVSFPRVEGCPTRRLRGRSALVIVRRTRAGRGTGPLSGVPTLTMLGALLVFSPLFSLQYASWLVPSIAVAWGERVGRQTAIPGNAALVSTGVLFASLDYNGPGTATKAVILARNAGIIWMTWSGVRDSDRSRSRRRRIST